MGEYKDGRRAEGQGGGGSSGLEKGAESSATVAAENWRQPVGLTGAYMCMNMGILVRLLVWTSCIGRLAAGLGGWIVVWTAGWLVGW